MRSGGIRDDRDVAESLIRDDSWRAVWSAHHARYDAAVSCAPSSESEFGDELVFCLLGGHGITFELSLSAAERMRELEIFGDWERSQLEGVIHDELSAPQFRPVKRDGSLRRYRYPAAKARLVADAVQWVKANRPLVALLEQEPDETVRRQLLLGCPGIGPKTASWLLRNAGLAANVAVLDVHVLRAMASEGRLPAGRLPSAYLRIEASFLAWCKELAVAPAAFDLFLWEWQRGDLRDRQLA